MISLCLDARMIHAGGIGTFLKNILDATNGKVKLTLLCFEEDREFLSKFAHEKIILMKSKIYSVQEQFELMWKIPRVDIFWSPHFNVPLLPIRARKRVATIHDTYHLTHFSTLTFLQKIYAQLLYNGACFLSECVTTDSEFSKEEIEQRIKCRAKNLTVIRLPIIAKNVSDQTKERVRKKYHLPNEFVLAVGTHRPHKNLKRLKEAYSGPLFVVERHNQVSDEELAALYSLATVFVFPSTYEGFGLPPLEALSYGCSVAVSNIPPLREMCGSAVYYFDPKSEKSIAETIEKAFVKKKGGEEYVKRFDMKTFQEKIFQVLK